MPRNKKSPDPILPVAPPVETVTVEKRAFQALHSAARAVYRSEIQKDNHSAETLVFLQLLDAAIDDGHLALGTERPAADQFIHLVSGITQLQAANARKILEQEGLLTPLQE